MNKIYKSALLFGIYSVFMVFAINWFLEPGIRQHIIVAIILAMIGGALSGLIFGWLLHLFKVVKAKGIS